MESNLSKKPPCPGMMDPLSFTSAMRFNLLSKRSPAVPKIAQIELMISASFTGSHLVKCANKEIVARQSMTPPIVPSHVF